MTTALRPLIISLKPCYADLVFEGLKKVELRRRIASQISDHDVFIYVSSPVRELRGGFRVGQVWEGSPEAVWSIVAELATLDSGNLTPTSVARPSPMRWKSQMCGNTKVPWVSVG